jgi:multicomponent Na+:H+ antiporter subunit D
MSGSEAFLGSPNAGGFLLVLAVSLPTAGMLLSLALGGRFALYTALVLLPIGLCVAIAIAAGVWRAREPLVYFIGGWSPPLGLALRADGLSAAMMVTTAIVICATGLYGRAAFCTPAGIFETRAPLVFWVLLMAIWAALNLVFLGDDLFNLYVALELFTFAAVPLVCLDGRAETLAAALRYLLFALLGSVFYLLGAALLYGRYGTLDIALLFGLVHSEPVAFLAIGLMTAGLLAKTALFPLHLWLPAAHAGAPPAASAVLSGLVVKASFFLVIRLWFDVMPGLLNLLAAQVLSTLGAGAILVGSVLALRQARLKLLIRQDRHNSAATSR